MLQRAAGEGHAKLVAVGEVRQTLLSWRMLLAKDHLAFSAMQRLPQAHPALQRAANISGEFGMTPLQLAQYGDRPQPWHGLQHRNDLVVPVGRQGIRTAPATWLALLRGQTGIGIEPSTAARAEAGLGRCGLPAVGSMEVHVQSRLLVGDVRAGHRGSLLGS